MGLITGRTTYREVEITPTPTDLLASQVKYRVFYGQDLKFEVEGSVLISESKVGITIDSDYTELLEEGIYIFEIIYTHDGVEDTVTSGTINILRRS